MRRKKGGFSFTLSKEKLEQTCRLSPEMKLTWLEEANEFVYAALSREKRRKWERFVSGEDDDHY